MNIGIIGAGSIGLLTASYLALQHEVTLYVRRGNQKDTLNGEGINLYSSGNFKCTRQVWSKCISSIAKGKEDCYIVCVKQTQLPEMMPYLTHLNQITPIIFLPNGMGHIQLIRNLEQPVFVGIVEHGAKRLSDNEVDHLGEGRIQLATFTGEDERLRAIVNQLHQRHFPIEIRDDYKEMLQHKLIINAVINPLTALFHVQNGSVIENAAIQSLAKILCKETSDVLQINQDIAWESVQKTAIATRENTSSMYADIRAGRKTEIDAISGYVIQQSKTAIPYTKFIYQAIKALEEKE